MTKELVLPIRPHANQKALIKAQKRFNVVAAGRRFGKTEVQKIRAIYMIMQGAVVWWVTPTFDNGTDTWLDLMNFFTQFVPRERINRSSRRIFLDNGGQLRMVGANNFKRGSGVNHIFIDEAAFCDLDELFQYQLRPMLIESRGGATFFSSTNGRNGFWKLYQRGLDPNEPEWESWHFTSYDNPLLTADEIDDIRRHTPERVFQQEYMAEFLDDGGAVFRNLKACTQVEKVVAKGDIVFGVDWGKIDDYTVITVLDATTGAVLEVDRFNQIDWHLQRSRLIALFKRYKPTTIYAERNSIGDPNIEALFRDGLPVEGFTTTAASKQEIINALALAFEQGDISIPDDTVLVGELQAFTLERLPSGNFRYTAPPGLHDDMVISLALAWHAKANRRSTLLILDYA